MADLTGQFQPKTAKNPFTFSPQIPLLISARERAEFNKSCNPIGSWSGREFPRPDMLLAGLGSVRIKKNCDLGLKNAAFGLRPRAAFSRPRSQFFTIQTSLPANNTHILHRGFPRASHSMWF